MPWTLHVEEEFSASHVNGPEGHKCNTMHGHDWLAVVEITYDTLDESGWGPDFGLIKSVIKPLDHNNLNEYFNGDHEDTRDFVIHPMKPSAENLASWIYNQVWSLTARRPDFVEVHEGGANCVTYRQ